MVHLLGLSLILFIEYDLYIENLISTKLLIFHLLYILYIESLENQFADICYNIFMLTNCISGNKNAFNKQNTFDL
jgi:hypothetical protein